MRRLAETILAVIRDHLGLEVGLEEVPGPDPDGDPVWRAQARSPGGEVWTAEHGDEYRAAVLLAEMVGMELED